MHVFVTGGSGFVGGHLVERLVRDGHRVSALARSDRSAEIVRRYGAEPVRAELDTLAPDALRGVDAVVHCAARAEDFGTREQFWAANVEGTRRLLAAARSAGVPRLVHVGTEAALFDGHDLVRIDESAPYPARQRFLYSETKAEAERLVLAANGPGLHTVSIRPRLVWGPRDTSVLPALSATVADGGFWWIGGGRKLSSSCYVDNVVEALVLALTRGAGGRAYFVTDGVDRPVREIVTSLLATRGITPPDRALPAWVAKAAAAVAEAVTPATRRPPMSRFAVSMLAAEVTVRDDAARAELGYRPVTSIAQGLAAMSSETSAAKISEVGAKRASGAP